LKFSGRQVLDQLREDGLADVHGPSSQSFRTSPRTLIFGQIEFKSFLPSTLAKTFGIRRLGTRANFSRDRNEAYSSMLSIVAWDAGQPFAVASFHSVTSTLGSVTKVF
jgi:hypothetical protein